MHRPPNRRHLILRLAWLPAVIPLVAAVIELGYPTRGWTQVATTQAARWEATIQQALPQPPPGSVIFNDPSPAPSHHDLSASSYVGVQVCSGCHGRLTSTRPNHTIIQEWSDPTNNPHANDAGALIGGTLLTRTIADGVPESPVKSCAVCHVTGAPNYNQPQVETQGGYDPTQPFNDYHHNALLLDVQCENCHGPGSQHVLSGGDPRLINRVPDPKETCWNCHVHMPNEKGNLLVAPATDAQIAMYSSSLGHTHAAGGLIAGTGGYEYSGEDYTQGHIQPHTRIAESCVTCHLYRDPRSPILDHSDIVHPKIAACRNCHLDANRVASLDVWDYLQARQQTIDKLLIQLGGADSTGAPDVNAGGGLLGNAADKTSVDYKRARWNYALVLNDGSEGAHNYDYALELLLTSIAHAPAQKPAAAPVAPAVPQLTVTLDPSVDFPGDGAVKATSITKATLLNTSGTLVETATVAGSSAKFDLTNVANGNYFIQINDLVNDLMPTRIDDKTQNLSQVIGTMVRVSLIGPANGPTYRIKTWSKGNGEHPVVKYSDGTNAPPERYSYALIYNQASPPKIEIRTLGTAALLTSFTPTNAIHPGAGNVPVSMWLLSPNDHGVVYNGVDANCSRCHGNLGTHAAMYANITNANGFCFSCHYGKGGDPNGMVDPTQ